MDCRKIEELLSSYLDSELAPAEIGTVRSHLSTCAACQQEYEDLLLLSTACKHMKEVVVPAPLGFKDSLMLRISEEELAPVSHQSRFKRTWKQAVAGAAAAIMLFLGAVSFNPGPIVQVANKAPVVSTEQTSPASNINLSADKNSTPVIAPVDQPQSTQPGSQTTFDKTANTPEVVVLAPTTVSTTSSSPVFLNKERAITTTLLKIKVDDSASAFDKAAKIASDNQAHAQNLGQQINENGSYTTVKITVAKASAGAVISKLSDLGTITAREVTNKDIGTRFAETLAQYQALLNQQASVQDAEQKAQLDKEIQTAVNELTTWEQNAEQETIVLWLEK